MIISRTVFVEISLNACSISILCKCVQPPIFHLGVGAVFLL